MAAKTSPKRNLPKDNPHELWTDLNARYVQSNAYFQKKRDGWEENEKLFTGERADSATDNGLITDGSLPTLIIERSARNTSQIQTGRVKELGSTTSAASTVADLIYTHDIVPNVKANGTFQSKLYQVHQAGGLYGTVAVMYGLNVTEKNAYADWWIIKPQLYYPQPGKPTIHDRQWAQVETTVTVGQLKSILKNDSTSWDREAVQKLIDKASEGTVKKNANDLNKDSYGNRQHYDQSQIAGKGDYAPITIRTEYQVGDSGLWITYAPDYDDIILRNAPNQHKNCKIPIVEYTPLPLLHEAIGLSDMDRGKPIQKTLDSFANLGYQNALLNTFPIIKTKTGATISSTLEMKPGANWRMDDLNAVQAFTTGNLSSEYFQSSISSLRSILLNQNGTTDTQQNSKTADNPVFGKTPQAIQQQSAKQNARDNLNIRMFDDFYGELATGLLEVKLNCATKPVQINLGKDQIAKLSKDADVAKLIKINGNTVEINLGPLKSGKYLYEVDPGTSVEADDATEHQRLTEIISTLNGSPTLIQMAEAEGYAFSAGALLKNYIASSGTKDQEEIIHKKSDEEIQAEQNQMAIQGAQDGQAAMAQEAQPQEQATELHPITQALVQDPAGFVNQLTGGAQ